LKQEDHGLIIVKQRNNCDTIFATFWYRLQKAYVVKLYLHCVAQHGSS